MVLFTTKSISSLIGLLNGRYGYADGYAENAPLCVNMNWIYGNGLTSLNQFSNWIRTVITLDKCSGFANYSFYDANGNLFKEVQGTLANTTISDYFDNVGFGMINSTRGDMVIDVDYIKISIQKK